MAFARLLRTPNSYATLTLLELRCASIYFFKFHYTLYTDIFRDFWVFHQATINPLCSVSIDYITIAVALVYFYPQYLSHKKEGLSKSVCICIQIYTYKSSNIYLVLLLLFLNNLSITQQIKIVHQFLYNQNETIQVKTRLR